MHGAGGVLRAGRPKQKRRISLRLKHLKIGVLFIAFDLPGIQIAWIDTIARILEMAAE